MLRALVALADPGDAVTADALPAHLQDAAPLADFNEATLSQPNAPLQTITRHAIDEALRACDHDVARAARRLGVHRSTVYRHLARQRPPAGNTKD
ncbi:Regulatory protein LuxO [compost metagenome]